MQHDLIHGVLSVQSGWAGLGLKVVLTCMHESQHAAP
jgi:hypothetical protein